MKPIAIPSMWFSSAPTSAFSVELASGAFILSTVTTLWLAFIEKC